MAYCTEGNNGYDVKGIMLGGQFIPKDLINKMYEAVRKPYKNGKCIPKIDEQEYSYEVFYGDYEGFINKLSEFKADLQIGGHNEKYHIDYLGSPDGEIRDINIGDYVVVNGDHLEIYTKDSFEKNFLFK